VLVPRSRTGGGGARGDPTARVSVSLAARGSYILRMLTARAATTPTVRNDAIDSSNIRVLMRTLSGMASVGLNALAFVNAT
jgi:hypothetical protein